MGREAAVRLFGADFVATTEFLGGTAEEHLFTERKKCCESTFPVKTKLVLLRPEMLAVFFFFFFFN